MAEARRMTKSELFTHFAERFGIKRAEAGEFFDELQLDRLLGQIIAILDALAKGERRLRGAEGEHPRRGVRPGPSSAAIPSSSTKTTCRLSAVPAQGGRLPVHAVASAGPTANLARGTPSSARGLLERSMNAAHR